MALIAACRDSRGEREWRLDAINVGERDQAGADIWYRSMMGEGKENS